MAHTEDGLIKAPVNIESDLAYVLGTTSGDIGYNITYGNINPWAMYKPVRHSDIGYVDTRNTLATLGFPELWKYGTNTTPESNRGIPYADSISGLIALYSLENNGWTYRRPRGALYDNVNSEYFRVADFCKIVVDPQTYERTLDSQNPGYNHHAKNPFGSRATVEPPSQSNDYGTIVVSQGRIYGEGTYTDTDLTIYDFNYIISGNNYNNRPLQYYGFVIKKSTAADSTAKIAMNTTSIGTTRGQEDLSCTAELNNSQFSIGTYLVYPFMTDQLINNYQSEHFIDGINTGQRLFPIPGIAPLTLEITGDRIYITPHAKASYPYTQSGTRYYDVNWSFTITNTLDVPITLTDVTIKFREPGKTFDESIISGEVSLQIESSITVGAGQTYSYPSSVPRQLSNFSLSQFMVGGTYSSGSSSSTISNKTTFILPEERELQNI